MLFEPLRLRQLPFAQIIFFTFQSSKKPSTMPYITDRIGMPKDPAQHCETIHGNKAAQCRHSRLRASRASTEAHGGAQPHATTPQVACQCHLTTLEKSSSGYHTGAVLGVLPFSWRILTFRHGNVKCFSRRHYQIKTVFHGECFYVIVENHAGDSA